MSTATAYRPMDAYQREELISQIGRMNILAISGGRIVALDDGIELPVGSGYKVRVRYTWGDEYEVQRVFVRGGKEFPKGSREAWAGNVGQLAYYASCFRNDDGEWTYLG